MQSRIFVPYASLHNIQSRDTMGVGTQADPCVTRCFNSLPRSYRSVVAVPSRVPLFRPMNRANILFSSPHPIDPSDDSSARESLMQTSYIVASLIAFSLRFRGDKSTFGCTESAYTEKRRISRPLVARISDVCLFIERIGWRGSLACVVEPDSIVVPRVKTSSEDWNLWMVYSRSNRWSLKRPSVELETKKWESRYK